MLLNIQVLFLFYMAVTVLQANQETKIIQLDIFYGVDDSASANWFKTDFNKHYEMFKGFVTFSFYPCKTIKFSSDGTKMICSSSNPDCYLDRLHSCASSHIKDDNTLSKFIACTFEHGCSNLPQCLLGDSKLADILDTCAKADEGFNLCKTNYDVALPIQDIPSFGILKIGAYGLPFDLEHSLCSILKQESLNLPNNCPSTT